MNKVSAWERIATFLSENFGDAGKPATNSIGDTSPVPVEPSSNQTRGQALDEQNTQPLKQEPLESRLANSCEKNSVSHEESKTLKDGPGNTSSAPHTNTYFEKDGQKQPLRTYAQYMATPVHQEPLPSKTEPQTPNQMKHPASNVETGAYDESNPPKTERQIFNDKHRPLRTSNPSTCEREVQTQKTTIEDYRNMYYELKSKVTKYFQDMKNQHEKLQRENHILIQEREALYAQCQEMDRHLNSLQAQVRNLQAAHVKSVNRVGTGLEPVSDQEFINWIEKLQVEVNSFFRRVSRGREIQGDPHNVLSSLREFNRFRDLSTKTEMKLGNILEMMFWVMLEHFHNNRIAGVEFISLSGAEQAVRNSDSSEGKDRTEFWRGYTISIITQSDAWKQINAEEIQGSFFWIHKNLNGLLGKKLSNPEVKELQKHVKAFYDISTDLLRQRSWYEFMACNCSGQKFDPSLMDDFKNVTEVDENQGNWVVQAVVSNGLVRKQHRFAPDFQKLLVKPKVILSHSAE